MDGGGVKIFCEIGGAFMPAIIDGRRPIFPRCGER